MMHANSCWKGNVVSSYTTLRTRHGPKNFDSFTFTRRKRMTEIQDFNDMDRRIIEEFRANRGNVGGQFAGVPILLLTTTGAKSGEPRIRPLAYLSEGGHIYVFSGNRGRPTNPAWYHNLITHPDVT